MQLSSHDAAFPLGSLVLVTGASGFIASHIVDQLLLAGYRVRGTVRDEEKVAWTSKLYAERHGAGKFSALVVPEMSLVGALDEAVKGMCSGYNTHRVECQLQPGSNAVIPPTIAGVINILHAASQEPSVKSFVYTSSSVASTGGLPGPNTHFSIDPSTWNEAVIKEAWSVLSSPFSSRAPAVVYSASKAEAEKALWKYVEREKPHFRVNAILPDANLGEVLSLQGSLSTATWVQGVFESGVDFVKTLPHSWYVNVDDTARIHIAALLLDSVSNERIFAYAKPFTWNEVLAIFRKLYPSKTFAEDIPGAELSNMKVSNGRAEQLLRDVFGRQGWTSLEQTVAEKMLRIWRNGGGYVGQE